MILYCKCFIQRKVETFVVGFQVSTNLCLFYRRFRYIAYCQFVRWCWGYLREDMHIPLPSCVV